MQAIIMAAGVGSRLGDLSGGLPKSYLPIAGETLLSRNIRLLRNVGVEEIVLVVGHDRKRFEKDFAAEDTTIVFNPFFARANVLSSFWAGHPYLRGTFLYLHADTVFDPGVLAGILEASGPIVLACDRKKCDEEEMKYREENGRVQVINKTMTPSDATGEFLGVCRISGEVLPELRAISADVLEDGEFSAFFEVALQRIIDAGNTPITVYDVGALPWREIDFPEDYRAALDMFEA